MILNLSGHLGASVSALVDGQLSADEEERAWGHVMTCAGCRRQVEHEGWVKQTLSGMGTPSVDVRARMYDVHAWAAVDHLEHQANRRRAPLAVVGVGSVGLAVVGLMALTSPPAGRGEIPGSNRPAVQTNIVDGGTQSPGPWRRTSR